jgi:tetratricopeptide (TPR) repeat protein
LIDDKAYLFDARLGLEIPGPGGDGVATLDQAIADPAILDRMNLPGLAPYGTSRASLLGSPTKLGILIDSSQGYFSPKMKLLQAELAGSHRTILYRDAAEQRDHFARVLGNHAGLVSLWEVPLEVETRLFTDPQFVQAIQASLFLFRPEWPLLYARVKHLRGEFDEAIEDYVRFRFAENHPLVNNKKLTIPKEVQEGLDAYATYYLALAHLERNNLDQAELMFQKTLELLPEPGPKQPFYSMFRRGANANLGRIYELKKDPSRAIAHYTRDDSTQQYVGNLLRARELIWRDPMGVVPAKHP